MTLLRRSPALLERAHSLTELGRRYAEPADGRRLAMLLGEALDLAAGCGARALTARAREELKVDRGPTAPGVAHRGRGVDPERAADRATGSGGTLQPPDRPRNFM